MTWSSGAVFDPFASLDLVSTPVFVVTVPGGDIVRRNVAAHRWADRAQTVDLYSVLHAPAIVAAIRREQAIHEVEVVVDTPVGLHVLAVSVEPIRLPATGASAIVATCHDITPWHGATAARSRAEQRAMVALDAAKLGAWELNPISRRLDASVQCRAIHGLPPDAEIDFDATVLAAVEDADRGRLEEALRDAVASGGDFEIEVRTRWPDGSRRWLRLAGRVLDPACVIGVSLDVTARHSAEEALREADHRKDEFIGVVGHELRNPLSAILAAARLLQKKGPPNPDLQRLQDTVVRQALQLSRVVDDLLDVGRIVSGKVRLDRRVVDATALVRQAVEACGPALEQRRHHVTIDAPEAPVWIDADPSRILQALGNIVNNAAKYTPDGGHIHAAVAVDADEVAIRIVDNGVGIAPEMLERIFQRFVQARPVEHDNSGLGIGLSLARVFVELHGGRVAASSDGPGTGSEFTVWLPVVRSG